MHIKYIELFDPAQGRSRDLKMFWNVSTGTQNFVKLQDGSVLLPDAMYEDKPNLYLYT
jgi:hypothetical protein